MDIHLTWNAEEKYIEKQNSPLLSSLKEANSIMSQLRYDIDYHIPSVTVPITPETILKEIISPHPNQSTLAIYPTKETISQIKSLLSIGQRKELHYSELKKTLTKMQENCIVDPQRLKRKLFSMVRKRSTYYFKLMDCIMEKIIMFDKAKKEIKEIEANMMKFKGSQIINLYFKLYYERNEDAISYMMSRGEFLLVNKQNLHAVIEIYQELIRTIVKQANNELKSMMKGNPAYDQHLQEYDDLFDFIEKVLELFPVLKHTDMKCPKVVFSAFDSPVNLRQSENEYLIMNHIQTQLPTYDALKVTFNNFKQGNLNKDAIEMALRKDCDMYKRFQNVSMNYIYASLLYEE